MARQKRIEFSGAFYHIIARGNRKQPIFISDDDRCLFLNCLREACKKHGAVVHAYCLMDNHYHLFIETPYGGLSKLMHDINTSYAVYFNKKHGLVGHPFQGRFKSILVQADSHALDVTAYIHLNPVRAKIAKRPEDYPWSNYREYIETEASQPWTSTWLMLRQFNGPIEYAKQAYQKFVLQKVLDNAPDPLISATRVGILGDAEFIAKIRTDYIMGLEKSFDRELPQLNRLLLQPRLADIRRESESIFGPQTRYSKMAAIFISHKMTKLPLKEIGEFYAIGISGITDICRKIRREIVTNGTLAGNIGLLEERVVEILSELAKPKRC